MNQESRIMVRKNKVKNIVHDSLFMIRSRGFTLIELLVAIGIIGILTSFLLANFVGIRQRARDGVRKSDLRQIQSALEIYRSDLGTYPDNVPNSTDDSCSTSLLSVADDCNSTVYMKKIPKDPSTGDAYTYSVSGTGNILYTLLACLENKNDSQLEGFPSPAACSGSSTTWQYMLQNP